MSKARKDEPQAVAELEREAEQDPLLTMAQVARLFAVARSTAWRWANEKKIDSVEMPSGVKKIRLSDVKRILGEEVKNPAVTGVQETAVATS